MIKIYDLNEVPEEEIFSRQEEAVDVSAPVADILRAVKERGDAALLEYEKQFDRVELSALEVTPQELEEGAAQVDPEFTQILREAAESIRAFHAKQKREGFLMTQREGVVLGQKITPLARVGIYVPGGTAAYPSTVLMNERHPRPHRRGGGDHHGHPAGTGREDPPRHPGGGQAGRGHPNLQNGGRPGCRRPGLRDGNGAQGGQDRGPGQRLCGRGQAAGAWVAADLLSQAEHDKMASAVLVTDSRELAQAVSREIEAQLQTLEREEIARASIEQNGKIIVARSLTQAAEVANRIAPEHLELSVDDPFDYLGLIENAGSIFLGRYNPEPMGDYFAGPNHTLPTMGTARFYSPLSVDDFIKKSQFSYYTRKALERDYRKVSRFAKEEGLTAHARAVDIRFEKEGET